MSAICLFLFMSSCPTSCPYLAQHLTPVIPVIGGVLFLFVLGTLLRTSFSDPGVLPRATPDEAADLERQIGKTLNYFRYEKQGMKKVLFLCICILWPLYYFTHCIFSHLYLSYCIWVSFSARYWSTGASVCFTFSDKQCQIILLMCLDFVCVGQRNGDQASTGFTLFRRFGWRIGAAPTKWLLICLFQSNFSKGPHLMYYLTRKFSSG